MVPPLPDAVTAEPFAAAALIPAICNDREDAGVPEATVALRFATTPDAKAVSFAPHKIHVTLPVAL